MIVGRRFRIRVRRSSAAIGVLAPGGSQSHFSDASMETGVTKAASSNSSGTADAEGVGVAMVAPAGCAAMSDVRREIDRLDRALVRLIAERQLYIEAASRIKDREDEVRLQWRIDDVLAKVKAAAAREGLEWSIAEPVWRTLMDRCIAHEGAVWRRLRGLPPKS